MHSSIELSEDTEKRKAIADEPVPPAITAASTPTTLTTPTTLATLAVDIPHCERSKQTVV